MHLGAQAPHRKGALFGLWRTATVRRVHFPITLHLGAFALPIHVLLELAAYLVGFALLRRGQARHGDVIDSDARWTLTVAASLPGLFFFGTISSNNLGPLTRFVRGAKFTSRHLARTRV